MKLQSEAKFKAKTDISFEIFGRLFGQTEFDKTKLCITWPRWVALSIELVVSSNTQKMLV